MSSGVEDLSLNIVNVGRVFTQQQQTSFTLVRVNGAEVDSWLEELTPGVRRCYAADALLENRAEATGRDKAEVLAAMLPDRGAVMAGDFGEILVFIFQASAEHPTVLVGPKKWRLKDARTRPAPYSDVVQFIVPRWPEPSAEDRVICSEVKTKSTAGPSTPIASAIADCYKDQLGRLTKTLVWLKDRALGEDLGTTTIDHLERFINAIEFPEATKEFRAVAVICETLLDDELLAAPDTAPIEHRLIVIAVPDLKQRYETLYDAVGASAVAERTES